MATTVYSGPTRLLQDNLDSVVGAQTLQLFHSIGTDSTGTLNAWTFSGGTPTIASNLVTIPGNVVMQAGHFDWWDGTVTARFKWVTGGVNNLGWHIDRYLQGGDYNATYAFCDGASLVLVKHLIGTGSWPTQASAVATLTNNNFYWLRVSSTGTTYTATVYNDSAGAIGTQVATCSATISDAVLQSGDIWVNSNSATTTTWGGAFSSVCTVTGPAPAGWSVGQGTGEPAWCWSNARYTSYGRSLSVYNAHSSAQAWWGSPSFTIAASTYYAAAAQLWAASGSNPTNFYLSIEFTGAGSTPALDSQWHAGTYFNNTIPAGTRTLDCIAYGAGTFYFDDPIVIGPAADQSSALLYGSMSCKWNTFDFALLDPATQPALNDTIVMADPYWVGYASSVMTADPVDRPGHKVATVAATNTNAALASPAPFGLSDNPDNSTTFSYAHLTVKNTQNTDGTATCAGSCTTFKTGLWPAMTFELSSANQGYAITQGGFETSADWVSNNVGTGVSSIVNDGNAHSGSFALKLTNPSAGNYGGEYNKRGIPIRGVSSIHLQVWAKTTGSAATTGPLRITFANAGTVVSTAGIASSQPSAQAGVSTVDTNLALTTSYVRFDAYITVPAGYTWAFLESYANAAGTATPVYIDDVAITTSFSVRDVSVTWQGLQQPVYQIDFGDPIVTMSVWANSTAAGILPITSTKITDGAVTTPKLDAGSVTADKLAATLVLASMIQGGSGPAHTEMDANGFRAYNANGDLVVNIPDDGSPVTINANVIAQTLQATGNAIFQGALNEITPSAVLQLDSTQGNPTQAPSIFQALDSISAPADGSYDATPNWLRAGLDYDSAGGAGGATKVFWTCTNKGSGHDYALELKASDRTVNRSIDLGTGITPMGVCRLGSYVYVLYLQIGSYQVNRYLQSTLAGVDTIGFSMPVSPPNHPVICQDGTNIYVVDKVPGTAPLFNGNVKWNKYDGAMTQVGSTIDTGFALGAFVVGAAAAGNFDFGAFRIAAVHTRDSAVYTFDSTGAQQSNEKFFGSANQAGLTYGDAVADGARFWSMPKGDTNIYKHSTWTWTTASSKYWVAYSWYDGTHETQCGPRASITMNRRGELVMTSPSLPTGTGVTKVRFYIKPNATDPGLTALKQQADQTAITFIATTYNSGGAADPGANGFPAGTAALLQSATAGIILRGDGTADLTSDVKFSGGTSAGLSVTQINRKVPVLLSTITGGTTHNFSSISGAFAELQFRFMWRSSDAVNAIENMVWRINNISTATYYNQILIGRAAVATSAEALAQTSFIYPQIPGGGTAQGTSVGTIIIPNYTLVGTIGWTANWYSWIGLATTNLTTGIAGGVTNNNGPVTRVEFIPPTGFWGSSVTEMWGIP